MLLVFVIRKIEIVMTMFEFYICCLDLNLVIEIYNGKAVI